MKLDFKTLILQTVFAFILFLMPTIALEPQDDSVYTVSDFFVYFTQAQMMVKHPGGDIYSELPMMQEASKLFPPLKTHAWYLVGEPPVSLTFVLPLALVPASVSLWVCKIFLVLLVSISVALLTQIFELNERQYQLSTILVALSGPLWEATRVTKPGVIVLFALTLCLLALKTKRPILAAVLFLPWTFKPQLMGMFLCEALAARQFKFVLSLVAATVALLIVTFPLFGLVNYTEWLAVLKYAGEHPEINAPFLHPTIRGQLMRFQVMPQTINVIAAAAFVAAQVIGLTIGWLARKKPNWMLLCVICLPLSVVCSPYCHNYDLVILIPSMMAFLKLPGLQTLNKPAKITLISVISLCLLMFEMPIYHRIHYDFLQHGLLTVSPLFCGLFILSLVFVAMAFRETTLSSPSNAAAAET